MCVCVCVRERERERERERYCVSVGRRTCFAFDDYLYSVLTTVFTTVFNTCPPKREEKATQGMAAR